MEYPIGIDLPDNTSICRSSYRKIGEVHMTKILSGIILTLFVMNFSVEIKSFTVETGIRDKVITHLKSW